MSFNKILKASYFQADKVNLDPSSITVYPVNAHNLEGIKILFETCKRLGSNNNNVEIATIDPSLWLGDFLDKYWTKISFVSSQIEFQIVKFENGRLVNKKYQVSTSEFINDDEIESFFNNNKFSKLVLFSVVKNVNLLTLKSSYRIRFTDISEKYEIRDEKIKDILG